MKLAGTFLMKIYHPILKSLKFNAFKCNRECNKLKYLSIINTPIAATPVKHFFIYDIQNTKCSDTCNFISQNIM